MFSKELFGRRLREIRQKNGESQKMLGAFLGLSTPQISEMKKKKKTTTAEKIALICRHYKISSDYLLGLKDEP